MRKNDFIENFKSINIELLNYGWIISPSMIGKDFQKVQLIVSQIKSQPPKNEKDRQEYLDKLNNTLTDIIFHPLFRAFYVFRSKEVNYLKIFSHHIERAIFHYYKNDYLSAVLCLIPAIEGSLLSYYGWQFGESRKPKIDDLIKEIERCRVSTYRPEYYRLYSDILSRFLRKWIFTDTSIADTTLSYLNRHYVTHGMGTGNYYSLADTHRLIMFFDLFIEFLSLEQKINHVFIPDNNKQINARRDYYLRFINKNIKRDEILNSEKEFIVENSNYYDEINTPCWRDIVKRAVTEDLEFIIRIKEELKNKGSH